MNTYNTLFLGKVYYHFNNVDSTNIVLRNILKNHKNIDGVVVSADHQTNGKGQRGNSWKDEPGMNIAMSIFFNCNFLHINEQFYLSKAISLGVIDCLNDIFNKSFKIKWPNDIYLDSKKLGGILIENTSLKNKLNESIVGIGLNVNQTTFDASLPNPTSLKNILHKSLDQPQLLKQMWFYLEKRYLHLKNGNWNLINKDYLDNLYLYNKNAQFKIKDQIVEGLITGVNANGHLQVKIENTVKSFDLKEISFIHNF